MIIAELRLRRVETPLRRAEAFLLEGADPARWLEAVARWSLPEASQLAAELFVLPEGAGVLIALGGEAVTIPPRDAARAYGRIASRSGERRIFLPVEAELDPELTKDEIDGLLQHDVAIVHPTLGWIGFELSRVARLSSLLGFPRLTPGRWRRPSSPTPWNRRIVSVSLPVELSLEDFFGQEKDDIGSSPLEDLPPSESEPKSGASSTFQRKLTEMVARGAHAFAQSVPGGASQPTWVDRLDAWARDKLEHVTEELQRARSRELYRLLDLLDKNVEEGLRRALPLGGHGLFRGRATPGGRLSEREVDFNLSAFGGGEPADLWDAPWEVQEKLREKYRELANREKKLGRFRRAAYIYGELLGDLDAAASVLMEGGHYREAAEVYRRHLDRPGQAARALEAGGFYSDAVVIYVELGKWEKAGDLYRLMEKEDEARDAYGRARDAFLALKDRLGAARVAEAKLRDRDAALSILEGGWPDTSQAELCLRKAFALSARNGLHERAGALLTRLSGEVTPPHLAPGLAECLAETAVSYPDAGLRRRASELTRRKVAGRLDQAPAPEAKRLVEALYTLEPDDRLLVRDGERFLIGLRERHHERAKLRETLPRRSGPEPEPVHRFDLPFGYSWLDARAGAGAAFVLGQSASEIALVRAGFDGSMQTLTWPTTDFARSRVRDGRLLMAIDASGQAQLPLYVPGFYIEEKTFPRDAPGFDVDTRAGDPGWFPIGTRALVEYASSWLLLRHFTERMILSSYSRDGRYRGDIVTHRDVSPRDALYLAAQNQFVVLGRVGQRQPGEVFVYNLGSGVADKLAPDGRSSPDLEPQLLLSMESPITGLGVAPPFTRNRLLVTMQQGLLLHWLDVAESCQLAPDLESPRACILRNGRVVVSSGRTLRIYRVEPEQASLTSEIELDREHLPVLDVLPDRTPNQFAALTAEGRLHLYALAR